MLTVANSQSGVQSILAYVLLGVGLVGCATWRLSVADAESSEITTITDRERQLLLRAWLSPVPPPPLEQLVDLS